jgi:hypothetical protein
MEFLRALVMTGYGITFSRGWITAGTFEHDVQPLFKNALLHRAKIEFRFPQSCKVMVDAAVRLLSLANQLVARGHNVVFIFDGEENKAISYLNRANFFTCLSPQIQVMPERPDLSYAELCQGNNKSLVEFESISPGDHNVSSSIPTRLIEALQIATSVRTDCKQLCQTAFTLFGELIDNIYCHSHTELDGFAALQVYSRGNKALVVVSDSGIGLLETLRPKLLSPSDKRLSDVQLIRSLFNGDVSWDSKGRGAGLKRCAELAIRHESIVNVRLATCGVYLSPSKEGFEIANIHYSQALPLLQGTHLSFSFPLDFYAQNLLH